MTLTQLRDNMQRFNAEVIVTNVYNDTKELLEDLNTEQLMEGQTANGTRFPGYKYDDYADLKRSMNPLPGYGNPDLKLTGAFHNSITAEVNAGKLQIRSTLNDEKVQKLQGWYGPENIYGLNEEKRQQHVEENIKPYLQAEIEQATGLKMQ